MAKSPAAPNIPIHKGLDGVVVDTTAVSKVMPETNSLTYRGYAVQDLCWHCSFEEVAYLLWNGELPDRKQLGAFRRAERKRRELGRNHVSVIKQFPRGAHPMDTIRTAVSYLGMATSYYSVTLIPLADAVSLQFTSPLWVALLAMVFLGESVGINRWGAIALGFIGVLVIMRPGFAEIGIGMLIALSAALFYAGGDITVRALSRTDSIPVIMFYGYILQLPLAVVPAALTWTTPGWDVVPALIAFVAVALGAQYCMTVSLSIADASLVTPVLFMRLPFVAAIGFVFFAQTPDNWTWLGAAIILSSTYVLARWERSGGDQDHESS